jgi:hypothetical protein
MKTARSLALISAALLGCVCLVSADDAWVFSYFVGNGEDGLHLAWSDDGLHWKQAAAGKPVFNAGVGSQKLMRDPCVISGPDGAFHMVWTTGWRGKDIGYASSRDLVHWSAPKVLPVMAHEPAALNCWAPELFYVETSRSFLIFWATTIPGRFPATDGQDKGPDKEGYNHRIYATTTRDFTSFTPTRLFYDPGFNVIDATMARDGSRFILILKDETNVPFPVQKNIRIATSPDAEGPFGPAGPPITGRYWCEGPTALRLGADWLILFDRYRESRMGAVRSSDLVKWEDVSAQIEFPAGMKHGTALKVPRASLEALLRW